MPLRSSLGNRVSETPSQNKKTKNINDIGRSAKATELFLNESNYIQTISKTKNTRDSSIQYLYLEMKS